MTFKEAMIKEMVSRGMFQSQANAVMDTYMKKNEFEYGVELMNENVSDYPEAMQTTMWFGVREHASEWIKNNLPEAWFRPMFELNDAELTTLVNYK